MQNHRSSKAILDYFCIFNKKFTKKGVICIAILYYLCIFNKKFTKKGVISIAIRTGGRCFFLGGADEVVAHNATVDF